MKFWLLTTEYPPFHGGGISTYCYHTACMLVNLKIDITTFIPDDTVSDYKIENSPEGNRLIRFNTNRSKTADYLGYYARLSYEFAQIVTHIIRIEGKPDIIEAQDYMGISYYLLQYKHLLYENIKDIPVVITLHSPAVLYLECNRVPIYRFPTFNVCQMEKEALRMADRVISPTSFIAEATEPYVQVLEKNNVIRNPYYVPTTGLPHEIISNKIVFYGKLSRQKGSFELLAYFKKLWDKGFKHPLHIIGGTDIVDHPEQLTMGQVVQSKYKKYINEGLLIFRGQIKPSSIETELQSAHVIIVPSILDNLPYVVIEAMAIGKVVLASVQGGQREMIEHGVSGFLFDHTIEGDFEEKLEMVLSLSGEKITTIGQSAKAQVASLYNPVSIGKQKLELLNELIDRKQLNHNFPFLFQKEEFNPVTVNGTLLTVVIPYYNMGKYITACIESVKSSTWSDIEILVINDGSTEEESISQLKQIQQIKGVKVLDKPNGGLSHTRNFGAAAATGDLMAFLDADDKVAPDYYEKAIRVLKHYNNVFFVGSFVQYFGESNKKWATYNPQPPYALVHNPVNSSALVYKRKAFLEAGLNDRELEYGLEDYESVVHLLSKGYNGIVLPEHLFYYRVRNDSMFRKLTREKLLYSYKYIAEKHTLYYANFAAQINNLLNANGPGFLFDNPTFEVNVVSNPEYNNWVFMKVKAFIKRHKTLKKLALRIKKINK